MTVKKSMVLYYADWCGHCREFKPVWNKAKEMFSNSDVEFIEYEATKHPEVMTKNQIGGFPTIRAQVTAKINGKEMTDYNEYTSDRSFESFSNFVQQLQMFTLTPVASPQVGGGRGSKGSKSRGPKLHREMLRLKLRFIKRMMK
jgi:thiol-disulfide isomerase/thioredoxin